MPIIISRHPDHEARLEQKIAEYNVSFRIMASKKKYRDKNREKINQKYRERWQERHPNGKSGKGRNYFNNIRQRIAKPVINDNNEEYENAKNAAKYYKINVRSIYLACDNYNRVCCGRRWTYKKNGRPKAWDSPADAFSLRVSSGKSLEQHETNS